MTEPTIEQLIDRLTETAIHYGMANGDNSEKEWPLLEDERISVQLRISNIMSENNKLRSSLSTLFTACLRAGAKGELAENINGGVLDKANEALK